MTNHLDALLIPYLLLIVFSLVLLLVGLIGCCRWLVIEAVVVFWVSSLRLVNQTLWRWLDVPLQFKTSAEAPAIEVIIVSRDGRRNAPSDAY